MKIPFGLGAYQRANNSLPSVRLINRFAERTPTAETGVVLLQRPGLRAFADYGGQVRGFYRQDGVYNGDLFTVCGTTVYRGAEAIGTVTGTDLVQWTYTVDGLRLLADGSIYLVNDASLTRDTFVDDDQVVSITSINNILLAARRGTQEVYFRIPGDTSWAALDYLSAEAEPDQGLGLLSIGGEVWVMGSSSVEIFYPTDQVASPLQVANNRQIQRGIKSRDTALICDNTVLWVGENGVAYRYDGVPVRISDHAIEEKIQASASCSAWTYALAGHLFYVVNLDDECLCYDVATGQWHQLRRYGKTGFVATGFFDGSTTYVGDEAIWTLDPDMGTDDGQPIERIFTSVLPTEAPVSADCLEIGLSPGTTPISTGSVIETRWSRDQGRTWTGWTPANLGSEGAYRVRARIRRLGMIDAPGRVFEHRETDSAITRISSVELNPPGGGRSR